MRLPLKDKTLWAETAKTSIYVKNIRFHSAFDKMTPYEAPYDRKLSIKHLKSVGRKKYVLIPK
ncbi:hypothetical protein K3495_g3068 [Podosphaera aphanis]|nr:hypothetical protein K3495_g3068 [Podosphaera aphanis]